MRKRLEVLQCCRSFGYYDHRFLGRLVCIGKAGIKLSGRKIAICLTNIFAIAANIAQLRHYFFGIRLCYDIVNIYSPIVFLTVYTLPYHNISSHSIGSPLASHSLHHLRNSLPPGIVGSSITSLTYCARLFSSAMLDLKNLALP